MEGLLNDGSFTAAKAQKAWNIIHVLGKGATSQNSSGLLGLLEKKTEGASETEISRLKESIKNLEAEKEDGLAKFYELLKKASNLELRVISAEQESGVLKEKCSKYDADTISCLQENLNEAEDHARRAGERARKAENEIERLKKELAKLEEEREHEISSVLENLGSMEKLIDEKLSLEIERSVVINFLEGVAYDTDKVVCKNVVLEQEKECLISQVKKLRELIEGLNRDNEVLVLERSLLLLLFRELKIEAAEAEEERKVLQEDFNNASRKVLELETEAENLYEILRQKENKGNEHEEKLKLEYQNLKTQMAKVVQENMLLRKDFSELRQQNLALHEVEQNIVAMPNKTRQRENCIEVLSYGKKVSSLDEQQFSEAVDVELVKETTKQDRTVTVEKTMDIMTRFSKPNGMDTDIKCSGPKSLAEELRYYCSCGLDDLHFCAIHHNTPNKSHIGLKMASPLWGLKTGKPASKASSVNSDVSKDITFEKTSKHVHHGKGGEDELRKMGQEKKHKGRMSDLGKKLHLKNYLPGIKKKEKITA